ncbi:MAG: hypothetical protein ACO1N5_17955 [Noviherbaspirillum sp.]
MEKTGVAARLRELATGNEQRKEVAKLRAVFDDVEAALAAGVKRTAILEVLREGGLKMSQGTFDTQVYRIRKSRKALVAGTASAPAAKPDAAPEPAQADAAKAPAADAPPAQVAPDTGTQAPVRLPDIQQSQEKARRYISGPLDFDVDNLIKKGNQ